MVHKKQYLTRDEVAADLRVNVRTIDRWREKGILEFHKLGDGDKAPIRISIDQYNEFLERTQRKLPEAI